MEFKLNIDVNVEDWEAAEKLGEQIAKKVSDMGGSGIVDIGRTKEMESKKVGDEVSEPAKKDNNPDWIDEHATDEVVAVALTQKQCAAVMAAAGTLKVQGAADENILAAGRKAADAAGMSEKAKFLEDTIDEHGEHTIERLHEVIRNLSTLDE